jgi:hypothetical protein
MDHVVGGDIRLHVADLVERGGETGLADGEGGAAPALVVE